MGGDASGIDAGLFGFLVLMALFVAGGLLGWSMLRHIRKVPPSFGPPAGQEREPGDGPPAAGEPTER